LSQIDDISMDVMSVIAIKVLNLQRFLSRAPVMRGPDDSECVSVHVACKPKWRLRSDTTKKCPRNKIPTEVSGVGKK